MGSTLTLTTMFTDVVDSTAISSRLGPEAAERFRQSHFGLVRAAVTNADGREVKNTGDGFVVVFSSLSAALACAVAIQQAVARNNRSASQALSIRIGLSHGDLDQAEGDFFGPSMAEAARLCAAAAGGQILTTDLVRLLVGARGGHTFASVGPLELKGFPQPVPAVAVEWWTESGAHAIATPFPDRLQSELAMGFVGRDSELEQLRALLRDAEGDQRRIALVGGEAGIGKTSLMARLAAEAYDRGAVVLYGRCDEGLGFPYQPWVEALGHLVEHAPAELLEQHVATFGPELARLAPGLGRVADIPRTSASDTDLARYEVFAGVVGLLLAVAEATPLLVVLDDLHWADTQSLLLLRHLITHTVSGRLFVIGSYRDVEVTESHPLSEALAASWREPGVDRMVLVGLDDHSTLELVEVAGYPLDETSARLAHTLYLETDGNPFFTLEVLRHLVESRVLSQGAGGRWSATVDLSNLSLPVSVREVIGQRLQRLGDPAYRVLVQAAVIGKDFELALLAAVCGRSEDELLNVLEPAVAARVVIAEHEGFSFGHALIQHSLYEALSPPVLRRAHVRVAQGLEELCGNAPGPRVAELARHWMAAWAPPIDGTKAIEFGRQAGALALASLAPEDAVSWFGQALQIADQTDVATPTLRCDLLIGLGTAKRQSGDAGHRETLLAAAALAAEIEDAERLAQAALESNPGIATFMVGVDTELLGVLKTALSLVGADDSALRAELMATLALELGWSDDWDRRRSLAEESVAIARRIGDPAALVRVLRKAFHAVYTAHTHDLRRGYAMQMLDLTAQLGDPGLRGVALETAMWVLLDAVELDQFDELLAEQQSVVERIGEPTVRQAHALLRATRVLITPHTSDESEAALDELHEACNRVAHPDEAIVAWGALAGVVAVRRGEIAELVPLVEFAAREYPGIQSVEPSLAYLYAELGRTAEASQLLAGRSSGLTSLRRDRTWLVTLANWAGTVADLGLRDLASVLHGQLAPMSGLVILPTYGAAEGPVAFYLGCLATTLGDVDDAERYFTKAEKLCRRIGAEFWLARNQLAHARMLSHGSGEGRMTACRLLDEAMAIGRRLGYRHLEAQAAELLIDIA
jgi:hypothetical protein